MTRQRLTISSVQMAALLGLENLIPATGLILLCPRCLEDGDPRLDTDNIPTATEWKIDCQCRERRIINAGIGRAMDADGELAASVEQILGPLSLSLRCPEPRCIRHPLEVERTPEKTIIRCRCAKTTLRLLPPTVH